MLKNKCRIISFAEDYDDFAECYFMYETYAGDKLNIYGRDTYYRVRGLLKNTIKSISHIILKCGDIGCIREKNRKECSNGIDEEGKYIEVEVKIKSLNMLIEGVYASRSYMEQMREYYGGGDPSHTMYGLIPLKESCD